MRFALIYRASLYGMLFLATLVVTLDSMATVGLPPLAYAALVAIAGAIALVSVDRNPDRGLPRWIANYVLGLGSIYVAYLEFRSDNDQLIHALSHLLIYLIVIKIFLPMKSARDDWTFFLLGLVLVLIGGWVSPSDTLGVFLLLWAVSALWTLSLFHLSREASRNRTFRLGRAAAVDDDPYPGLIDRSFLISALRVALTTLTLGGLIFLVMPRWSKTSARGQTTAGVQHLTGFSEKVRLGQIGEMLENDSVVMSVELYDPEGARVQPRDEDSLWRGVTLERYEDQRWSRGLSDSTQPMDISAPSPPGGTKIRQVVKLEANLGDVLFALRPILMAKSLSGGEIEMSLIDGTLERPDVRESRPGVEIPILASTRAFEYEVVSLGGGSRIQPFERPPVVSWSLLSIPPQIEKYLSTFARPIVEAIPEDQRTAERIATEIEAELRDSGKFSYSLRMVRTDPNLDPIVDFLENHKQGHCEYFASALTLLLRSQKIPARLVNGFKGGDWNALGGVITVRQKHAHSWVEALVSRPGSGTPDWMTLDPTPIRDRDASVASVNGGASRFRTVNDYLRYIWTFYIVGYSSDRQQRLVYGPARELFDQAMRGFRVMGQAIGEILSWLVRFRDVRALFSVKGFFVSTLVMLVLAVLARVLIVLRRRVRGWLGDDGLDDASSASAVVFYARLVRLLAEVGLERSRAETPREFARRASVFLAARSADADGIADVPPQVVEAFYQVRFGQAEVSTEDERRLDARLDELASHLAPAT